MSDDAHVIDHRRLACIAANVGSIAWDVRDDRLVMDEIAAQLFGRRAPFTELVELLAAARPESSDRLAYALERAISTGVFDVELEVDWPDASAHRLHVHGSVLFDPDGEAEVAVGAVQEIGELARVRARTEPPQPPSAGGDPALDPSVLASLDDLGRPLADLVFDAFESDSVQLFQQLANATNRGDAGELARGASTLGVAAMRIGALGLCAHCSQLEQLARDDDLLRAQELLADIDDELSRARGALAAHRTAHNTMQ